MSESRLSDEQIMELIADLVSWKTLLREDALPCSSALRELLAARAVIGKLTAAIKLEQEDHKRHWPMMPEGRPFVSDAALAAAAPWVEKGGEG